ncbi:MAG TPA: four helix bundle protein [Burkholderiales bacterium]|nr:four helix bundle protein [Burkholderiales bacterium]
MRTGSGHHNLLAWQEAMGLVELVYEITGQFPSAERYGLIAQMRRAAVSIPSNIAEGAARHSSRELAQFLSVACGSVAELETQLELAARLKLLERDAAVFVQVNRVGRLVRLARRSVLSR